MPPGCTLHYINKGRETAMEHNEPILSGIHCEVANCVHNNGACCCTASEIQVKNRSLHPEETMCETFSEV